MSITLTFNIKTTLWTWKEIGHWCYSRNRFQYSEAKKDMQAHVVQEIKNQIYQLKPSDIPDFGKRETAVIYEWHDNTRHDLGNLAAGEKIVADAITDLGIWKDDRYVEGICHTRVRIPKDEEPFIKVTIRTIE